ncbi:hypothetical protein, partial [uncultured Selenomonas sp.]|uniref:hypothetical protein n=1 Tax=uncultured Selenomonas sp. TaxID=159275 RepID=UPI0028E789F1
TPPAFVLSQDQTLRKNLVFFRYAASRLRRVSSAHTSALPGRNFAVPCLAKKSLHFFSTPDTIKGSRQRKIALQFTESHDWLFLSLDTILSNHIKKLSIAFTNVVHNRCFIKISLDGHLA